MSPASPVTPGSLATPLALMTSATGNDRNAAAFAFGILAGRGGRAASPEELAAAGRALVQMLADPDRRARIAGARVAGRVFAVPFEARTAGDVPPGLADGLFALLNRESEIEQLAAMDALGLTRTATAVSALTDRYFFYRNSAKRALAGGALEALARIGDPATVEICKTLVNDQWSNGRDATALAVLFARERMLKDGSVAGIRQALDDRSRRSQAMGYLAELGVSAP
jgi:HEAT repeat protein